MNGMPMGSGAAAAATTSSAKPEAVSMSFKSDTEHGKKGPDGTWHDAGLPAIYTVHAGATVTVTLYNYDTSPHSFTAPTLGVDQAVPGGSASNPSQVTFKFTAPNKAGHYEWWCKFPCDPWATTHNGYMRGYVTVQV
jgi:plastocyanin